MTEWMISKEKFSEDPVERWKQRVQIRINGLEKRIKECEKYADGQTHTPYLDKERMLGLLEAVAMYEIEVH